MGCGHAEKNLTSKIRSFTMEIIKTIDAPEAIGPYSQAVTAGDLVFCSGQIPLDPATMTLVGDTVADQTSQVLTNLSEVLKAASSGLDKVVKTTVFLKDMNDFVEMNKIYAKFFCGHKPARATVEVARLPKDVMVEIECTAQIS
jgi:2-iminobutanoate/2-iminopropanoate deaminase